MTAKILSLFLDTNMFIQCRPLNELDWSAWKDFDEVCLIVSRPVLREIDNQKNRGNDRVGRRARQANTLIREIILGDQNYKLIQNADPKVRLVIELSCQPSPELDTRLDYTKPDDELIGCLYSYKNIYPKVDVRLLTNDTGPMASAKMLDLPFLPVPDDWLRPPESNEAERENNQLKAEVARLKKLEPEFRITCLDSHKNKIDVLEFERILYDPLTESEIAEFIDLIKKKFPIATDFGSREESNREHEKEIKWSGRKVRLGKTKEIYRPALDEDIEEYTDIKYPEWIAQCEEILRNLHTSLQREVDVPYFCFVAENDGTRPAKDALITIEVKGNFYICPPQEDEEDSGEDDAYKIKEQEAGFPLPPESPYGRWEASIIHSYARPFEAFDNKLLKGLQKSFVPFGHSFLSSDEFLVRSAPANFTPDPNGFYYKPERPMLFVESFSLECEQWRHGIGNQYFDGEISFDRNFDNTCGILEFHIHAENLSTPAEHNVSVRITTRRVSTRDRGQSLLEDLFRRGGLGHMRLCWLIHQQGEPHRF